MVKQVITTTQQATQPPPSDQPRDSETTPPMEKTVDHFTYTGGEDHDIPEPQPEPQPKLRSSALLHSLFSYASNQSAC